MWPAAQMLLARRRVDVAACTCTTMNLTCHTCEQSRCQTGAWERGSDVPDAFRRAMSEMRQHLAEWRHAVRVVRVEAARAIAQVRSRGLYEPAETLCGTDPARTVAHGLATCSGTRPVFDANFSVTSVVRRGLELDYNVESGKTA